MTLPALSSVFNSDQIDVLEQWINARIDVKFPSGIVEMIDGEAVVSLTSITPSSVVAFAPNFAAAGALAYFITDGVGFTITSDNSEDNGNITYLVKLA